jgi:hypothetical protein
MAIKVTKNEVDVETEIMQKLSEFGLSIDFNPDDSSDSENNENESTETEEENN